MFEQCQGDPEEGQEEVDGEHVLRTPGARQLQKVKGQDGGSDDHGLADLYAVDAGQDVDGVGAEHSQHTHVHVVEDTCECMCESVSV